ncbi:V-type ATP synthase subunit E [bacterium]|nr:V-type ATP synthase subunit E [bacterium]
MAVQDILKKIKTDAEAAASEIVADGKAAGEEILTSARRDIDAHREKLMTRARQHADEERNRIITLARLAARREVLKEKQVLIGRVFDETRKSILAMDAGEYRRLMRGFFEANADTGNEEVIIDANESRIDQAFLDEVSRSLGRGSGLKLATERRAISGGFFLREGKTETNCALDTILRDVRERVESDVAAILFGAGE